MITETMESKDRRMEKIKGVLKSAVMELSTSATKGKGDEIYDFYARKIMEITEEN